MKNETINAPRFTYLNRTMGAVVFFWTAIVICSVLWNVYNVRLQTLALAEKEAIANFNKDLSFRLWGTKHGGVYVPPTEQTPPNPYLSHIPDRDITLPSGKRLTLMNPAYMVRQMMADFYEFYGIKGRITSLKPLNPDNAPDAWEREALTAFERGAKEFFVITEQDGQQNLRLMRPLEVKAGCLKCHAQQGYKESDIRGGVGVLVPMAPYLILEKKATERLILSHLVIWLLGSTVLAIVYCWGKRFILEQGKSEEALLQSEGRFRRFFEQVPMPFAYVNKEGVLVDLNDRFVQVFGYTLADVPTLKEWWQLACPDEENRRWVLATWEAAVAKAAKEGAEIEPVEYKVTCRNGAKRDVLIGGIAIDGSLLATFVDITERKQGEQQKGLMLKRFQALWEISKMFDAEIQTVFAACQEKILEITDSEYAFYGFMSQDETILSISSWSKGVMTACGVQDVPRDYPIADSGLWGNAIRERRTIIVNDYRADNPGKKGLPEGHVRLIRLMVVPVFEDKRITALVVVANKASDYTEEDARQIDGLMGSVQLLMARRKAEEALRALNTELERRVAERTEELTMKNSELERINKLFVGRELRMVELKGRIKELESNRQEKSNE
jgi:two-component system, sensor histidine kinase and response regulator